MSLIHFADFFPETKLETGIRKIDCREYIRVQINVFRKPWDYFRNKSGQTFSEKIIPGQKNKANVFTLISLYLEKSLCNRNDFIL